MIIIVVIFWVEFSGIVKCRFSFFWIASEIRDDIEKAIKDMAEYTCVRFVKRHGEHDYVLFRSIYRR